MSENPKKCFEMNSRGVDKKSEIRSLDWWKRVKISELNQKKTSIHEKNARTHRNQLISNGVCSVCLYVARNFANLFQLRIFASCQRIECCGFYFLRQDRNEKKKKHATSNWLNFQNKASEKSEPRKEKEQKKTHSAAINENYQIPELRGGRFILRLKFVWDFYCSYFYICLELRIILLFSYNTHTNSISLTHTVYDK